MKKSRKIFLGLMLTIVIAASLLFTLTGCCYCMIWPPEASIEFDTEKPYRLWISAGWTKIIVDREGRAVLTRLKSNDSKSSGYLKTQVLELTLSCDEMKTIARAIDARGVLGLDSDVDSSVCDAPTWVFKFQQGQSKKLMLFTASNFFTGSRVPHRFRCCVEAMEKSLKKAAAGEARWKDAPGGFSEYRQQLWIRWQNGEDFYAK